MLMAPSRFYSELMQKRLGLGADAIEVVPNGIRLEGYGPAAAAPSGPPVVGYFARMSRDKGLEIFVDAFLFLARELRDGTTRAKIGGAATAAEEPLIAELKDLLSSKAKILGVVRTELKEVAAKFGDPRRTEIVSAEAQEIDVEDLIAEEDMVVQISNRGIIKRIPVSAFKRQGRGGRG